MNVPLQITLIPPQDLHVHWPLVRRGLEDIIRKLGPGNTDFLPEDQFTAIRTGNAQLHVVRRGARELGFTVTYAQTRPFSGRKEWFVWAVWGLPLRERQPEDNWCEVIQAMRANLIDCAIKNGCDRILGLSNRCGLKKFGFRQTVSAWVFNL